VTIVAGPICRAVADRAVLVIFDGLSGDAALQAVWHLDRVLAATPFPGFSEAVPATDSLLVVFDPLVTDHPAVMAALHDLQAVPGQGGRPGARHSLAVCYDGPDLDAVADRTGLDRAAVIALHVAAQYRVAMYGFAPGYAYLAGVPARLQIDRKPVPRRAVPAGSVIIAGAQCLVTTLTMPTGWWIVGRCFDRVLTGDAARPFLFDVGDRVTFRQVDAGDPAARGT